MWSCRKSAIIQLQEGRKEERVLLPLRQDVPNGGNCLVGGMSWENKSHGRSSHASGGVRLSKIFRSLSSDKKYLCHTALMDVETPPWCEDGTSASILMMCRNHIALLL